MLYRPITSECIQIHVLRHSLVLYIALYFLPNVVVKHPGIGRMDIVENKIMSINFGLFSKPLELGNECCLRYVDQQPESDLTVPPFVTKTF